ncbi:MAG TPA: hypothetical protein VH702_00400, partial [Vicinamibacterales bacterium]
MNHNDTTITKNIVRRRVLRAFFVVRELLRDVVVLIFFVVQLAQNSITSPPDGTMGLSDSI